MSVPPGNFENVTVGEPRRRPSAEFDKRRAGQVRILYHDLRMIEEHLDSVSNRTRPEHIIGLNRAPLPAAFGLRLLLKSGPAL